MIRLSSKEAASYGLSAAADRSCTPKKGREGSVRSSTQAAFTALCQAHGLGEPIFEFQFAPPRRWKFDFLWGGTIAVEKIGAIWIRGRHSRGKGQTDDMIRHNYATLLGYHVLYFTPKQFDDGSAFETIKKAMEFLEPKNSRR